ncbi:MAG: hypothetical protein ACRD1K_20620 [Acidimicrobiales bacterium]
MSRRPSRQAARIDPNQPEIVEALRKAGAQVYPIQWPFDLLVAFRGELHLLEVKVPGGGLGPDQKEMAQALALSGGYWVHVVRSVADALVAIGGGPPVIGASKRSGRGSALPRS